MWKDSDATTTMAQEGTAVFQITTTALLSDMNLAPARFIAVNRTISSDRDDEPASVQQTGLAPVCAAC